MGSRRAGTITEGMTSRAHNPMDRPSAYSEEAEAVVLAIRWVENQQPGSDEDVNGEVSELALGVIAAICVVVCVSLSDA